MEKCIFKLNAARHRCVNKKAPSAKNYANKGIKCFLTKDEVRELWKRDKASKMDCPSIDRINPDANYEFSNCRFIERRSNASLAHKERTSRFIGIALEKSRKKRSKWRGYRSVNGIPKRTKWCFTEGEAIREYEKVCGCKPVELKLEARSR